MKQIKILIIEDEQKVAFFIKKGLEENSFSIEIAYDGTDGKYRALTNDYDLIVLDLNLPFINGFQLCKIIREAKPLLPILILTAMGRMEDKLIGFDLGADDYLLKPFDFNELLARVKALLKRSNALTLSISNIIVADLEINRNEKTIKRAGKSIELSAKEYSLLEYLTINKNRLLSRLELSVHVWGLDFDTGTNIVDVYINYLRKKMDKEFPQKLIHTRVGLGYMLKDPDENIE